MSTAHARKVPLWAKSNKISCAPRGDYGWRGWRGPTVWELWTKCQQIWDGNSVSLLWILLKMSYHPDDCGWSTTNTLRTQEGDMVDILLSENVDPHIRPYMWSNMSQSIPVCLEWTETLNGRNVLKCTSKRWGPKMSPRLFWHFPIRAAPLSHCQVSRHHLTDILSNSLMVSICISVELAKK